MFGSGDAYFQYLVVPVAGPSIEDSSKGPTVISRGKIRFEFEIVFEWPIFAYFSN